MTDNTHATALTKDPSGANSVPGERRESHSFGNVPQYKSSTAGGDKPYQVEDANKSDSKSNVGIIGTVEDGVGYFGRRVLRILLITCAILWYALMSLAFWFDTDDLEDVDKGADTSFVDGYNCKGVGLLFILFACLACLLIQGMKCTNNTKTEYWQVNIVVLAVLIFGGFLYLIGSFVIAGSIAKLYKNADNNDWRSRQTWHIADGFFIFLLSTILGLDVWRNYLGLSVRLRSVVAINITYLFTALLDFFAFAGLSSDSATDRTRTVATGFFFVLLGGIMLLILEFIDVCCQCVGTIQLYAMKLRLRLLLLLSVVLYLFGTFLVDCGLWAIADHGDFNSEDNAAIVGITSLFTFVSIFVSLDVILGEYLNSALGKSKENEQKPANNPQGPTP